MSWSPSTSLKNSEWKHWFHFLFQHFFSSIYFKDNMCFKTNVHCVWHFKLICVLIYQKFLCLHIIFSRKRLSILIILDLFFYSKLNQYFLFHLARHHQKKLTVMIVTLTLKASPGVFSNPSYDQSRNLREPKILIWHQFTHWVISITKKIVRFYR